MTRMLFETENVMYFYFVLKQKQTINIKFKRLNTNCTILHLFYVNYYKYANALNNELLKLILLYSHN